jgi:membrane protease YdiL (CAAX protease family)
VLSLATIFSAPVAVGLSLFFAWLRKGMNVRDYLGLRWPGTKTTVRWCIALLGFVAVSDTVSVLLGKPIVPQVMEDIYRRAQILPLLWVAVLGAGPIAEEFLFRGFLLTGLRHSRLGATAAVILTSAVWAAIHQQYDTFGIALVFLLGIILGIVRVRTGSTLLCILLHAFLNFIATIQVVLSLSFSRA